MADSPNFQPVNAVEFRAKLDALRERLEALATVAPAVQNEQWLFQMMVALDGCRHLLDGAAKNVAQK